MYRTTVNIVERCRFEGLRQDLHAVQFYDPQILDPARRSETILMEKGAAKRKESNLYFPSFARASPEKTR